MDGTLWGKEGRKRKVIPPPRSTSAAILNIFHRNPNKNDTSDLPFTFSEESQSAWKWFTLELQGKQGKKACPLSFVSVSTFALILPPALNQIHLFRALSTDAAEGITWETPLKKKAKPVLEGAEFLVLKPDSRWSYRMQGPRHPGALGRGALLLPPGLFPRPALLCGLCARWVPAR